MFWLILLFAQLVLCGLASGAQSVRTVCKQDSAGILLAQQNQLIVAEESAVAARRRLAGLDAAIATSQKQLTTKTQQAKLADFDRALEADLLGLGYQLKNLQAQRQETEAAIRQADSLAKTTRQLLQADTRQLSTVFKVTRAQLPSSQYQTFVLNYRHPCPEFRRTCPLPKAHRQSLQGLKLSVEIPLSCQRYAKIGAAKSLITLSETISGLHVCNEDLNCR